MCFINAAMSGGRMFLKIKKRNNKQYLSLVESYWDKGQSRQRTVVSLGNADDFQPAQLKAIGEKLIALSGGNINTPNNNFAAFEEVARINWGAALIYSHLWKRFELDQFLKKIARKSKLQFDLGNSVFTIVISRLIAPTSKLKLYSKQSHYHGRNDVSLQHLYRSLDRLADSKDELESHLFAMNRSLFNLSVDVVFYDVTTLYFESNCADELKDFGYSKDCKFNEVQVVIGLLIDKDGRPIGFDVYPGNTFEGSTLTTALNKLKQRFTIERVIIVADRGLNAKMNLKAIRDAGYHYIVGSRLKSMSNAIKTAVLDTDSYAVIDQKDNEPIFKIKEISNKHHVLTLNNETGEEIPAELDEKIVCSWSAKRARKDKADRERLIEKAKSLIGQPSKLNDKRGAKKYINKKSDSSPTINQKKIADDEKWDGIYGIHCSDKSITSEEVLDAYHSLWRIEEAFRVLKSSLELRPVYHWTPKRIRGHLVSCFIAFLLERTLELELREGGIEYSTERVREAITAMEASKVHCGDQAFYLRAQLTALGKAILEILHLKAPKSFTPENEFLQ
jgi:transposase